MASSNSPTKSLILESYFEKDDSIASSSHCSCSHCNLNDCFKLRNQNSTSICNCNACKQATICADSNKVSLGDPKNHASHNNPNNKEDNDSVIKSKIIEIQKEIFPEIADTEISEIDNHKYTEYRSKDVSLKEEKIDWNKDKKVYEKSSTKQYIHSVAITYSPKEREKSTVKLSAQIMDMPYEEVKDSLATDNNNKEKIKNENNKSSSPLNFTDLIKPYILTRLKEIYKACSCRVCECITGKSVISNNGSCGCSPCDCEKCINYKTNLEGDINPPHSGCPCVKCDRKDCRGVVKNTGDENCDYKPCDCVKCVENFPRSCNCVPCQCTECVALGLSLPRSIIVAPVQGNFGTNTCQCEPFDCDNCTHNYAAMSSNLRREISTDGHRNCQCDNCLADSCQLNGEVCRCDMQNKIIKKSLEKASPDYDIHRTVKSYRDRQNKLSNQDTIAMFALSDNYSSSLQNGKVNFDNCHCLECECFFCNKKQKYQDENKINQCETFEKGPKLFTDISSMCKCSPCHCQICERSNNKSNELGVRCFQKYCGCKKCDCLVCKRLLQYSKNNVSTIMIPSNFFQEVPYSPLQEPVNFPKKGRIFTPPMFEVNIRSASKLQTIKRGISNEFINIYENKSMCSQLSRDKKVIIYSESKHNNMTYPPNVAICPPEYKCLNKNIKNITNKKVNLKRTTTLSKNNDENIDSIILDEIFNSSKRSPIRDMDLLNKYIYLAKSQSKISDVDFNITIKKSENIIQVPKLDHDKLVYSETSNKISLDNHEMHSDWIKESANHIEKFNKISSKSILSRDEKVAVEAENEDVVVVGDHAFEKSLPEKYDLNNSIIASNEFVNPKEDTVASLIKGNEIEGYKEKFINPKQPEFTIHRRNVNSKAKYYCKMYRKLIKRTKDKSVSNKCSVIDDKANGKKTDLNNNVLPIIEDLIRNVESKISNIDNSVLNTKGLSQTENIFINKINEEQNIEQDDGIKLWPILNKNLYLSSTQVVNNKSICTIPTMALDIKNNVKSISMQISESHFITEARNGKQALAHLLIEVKNLLNSPLLQSSRSSTQSTSLRQTSNSFSKTTIDSKYKSIYSDAVSQTLKNSIPVDKETNCNVIHPMESLYKNMKQLVNLILARAAYKSDMMTTTKFDLTHDCIEEIPKINSVNSTCDGLKAAFIGLKTISDHTVMVKWRLPRQVVYVLGYELQVDGRPVQKIFSPTRCMAVLTCLPHADKLLLTIRTLTKNLPSDHNPASTIVYQPRVK